MMYNNFEKECKIAFKNKQIDTVDYKLLLKIAKAITKEDNSIKMSLEPFHYHNKHCIKCESNNSNIQSHIKKAMQQAFVYHQNVYFGWTDCEIIVPASQTKESIHKLILQKNDETFRKQIAKKQKRNCQFANLVDYIVYLVQHNQYNKCDGIIEYYIRNYNTSQLITEEEMIEDLKIVRQGTTINDDDEYQYSNDVNKIAQKYNEKPHTIEHILEIKIRCFDPNYLCKNNFFGLTTEDKEIIDRKLNNQPIDDVKPFKLLYEIDI